MLAKNEREYRFTSNWIRYWSLIILLLSVVSLRRTLLKTTHPKNFRPNANSRSCIIPLAWIVNNSIKSKNTNSDNTTYNCQIVYSWYFIILKKNIWNWRLYYLFIISKFQEWIFSCGSYKIKIQFYFSLYTPFVFR